MILKTVKHVLSSMSQDEIRAVAQEAGVPYHTLRKISTGETPNPRIQTVEPVASALGVICSKHDRRGA